MKVHKLSRFADARGWSLNDIYAMYAPTVKEANSHQINYSILYPGIIKAWHRHKYQDDYFCVLNGNAQVGVFSEKPNDKGMLSGPEKIIIGELNPSVVQIEAGEWHGLTCVGDKPCGLLYLVTNKYNQEDPDEERASWENFGPEGFWFPENI